jgi:hypothetical protein
MSSGSEPEFTDFITDESQQEEGSMFLPAPEPNSDPWMRLVLGIMAGLGGAALVTLSPWLSAALIAIGYGVAALNLRGSANRFGRALSLGFAVTALLGVLLAAGEATVPLAVQHVILEAGKHQLIFPSFALLPWVLAVLRYVYAAVRALIKPGRGKVAGGQPRRGAAAA